MNIPYAHSHPDRGMESWQPLRDHLLAVAAISSANAHPFGAASWGHAVGLLHDLGKCSAQFQEYLRESSTAGKSRRGGDHASYGAQFAVGLHAQIGRLMAYAIAGHHGGLPDGVSSSESDLQSRLQRAVPPCPPDGLGLQVCLPEEPIPSPRQTSRQGFTLSFFIRMLYSSLVDADFLDSERFLNRSQFLERAGWASMNDLADRFFPRLQDKAEAAQRKHPGPINSIRAQVLEDCLAAATLPPGLFSLTVPTGGGKTLSSMAFALKHAQAHGMRRIIYVIPYTSIIEQNAGVFRDILAGDNGEDAVLEHHSTFDADAKGTGKERMSDPGDEPVDYAAVRRQRLAAENWDAPVIATTAVQFFESLFAYKPSRCRKLHNIARSVVILDEAQMLPQPLLLPCLEALRELAWNYGVSIVLCTATQPALGKREDFPQGLEDVREIIQDPLSLHAQLRRTKIEWGGERADDALVDDLAALPQALVICNTRERARTLFSLIRREEGSFHLSAAMTPKHRTRVLGTIRQRLKDCLPCRVVATSLVEAGVDVDFPIVFRELAGIDSIAQAAGRCNREGRAAAPGRVVVFTPEAGVPDAGDFKQRAGIAAEVFRHHGDDPLSPVAVEQYFEHLFWLKDSALDKNGILQLLRTRQQDLDFAFRQVGDAFQVIEHTMQPVVIPLESEAAALVAQLEFVEFPGATLRKLQRFTVQIQSREYKALGKGGALRWVNGGVAVLNNEDLYDASLGLICDAPEFRRVEGLII